jgi:long-chain acyl-CoA synthetase
MAAFEITEADLQRVCRDLAYSEIATLPGFRSRLGSRLSTDALPSGLSWADDGLALDSLARMNLATAAATWCNAYDAGFEDLFLAKRNVHEWAVAMRRARQAGAKQWTFATSGSTGTQKHIRHREDILADEARAWAKVLAASPSEGTPRISRVIVLCPTHHIYGFIWGVLLPLALDVPALDAELSALPQLQSGDLVVAVPDQWAWLASKQSAWPAGIQGASSTAPMPAQVHDALTLPLPSAADQPRALLHRLLQIYGSTETAGLAYRTQSSGPYALAWGRVRNAQNGIDLTLPSGALQTMAVQDELQWVDNTCFNLLRRTDQSVQVAGHNVSPAWVMSQLESHPAVQEASVRLDGSSSSAKLKAFVVLKIENENPASQRTELEDWIINTLPWYANFSSLTYGTILPRNAMGKLTDWPISSS